MKWTEAECSRQEKSLTGKNKRAAMGNAMYQIRFASMTLKEFGPNVSQSGILTPEEIILFYDKFSGLERTSAVWNLSERVPKEGILLRCCRFSDYGKRFFYQTDLVTWKNELCFVFSKSVKLRGVRLWGSEGRNYAVKLKILSQSIENKFHAKKNNCDIPGFDVMLPLPIKVQANIIVHLKVTMRGLHGTLWGEMRNTTAETSGITVNFIKLSDIKSGLTNVSVQDDLFNEIIFSEI